MQLEAMYLAILVGSVLATVAIFTSVISFRIGAPLLLVFLGIGLIAGEDGILGIPFDNAPVAYFIGSVALALILFDSGFGTPTHTLRSAAAPSGLLATVGVVLTTGLVAVFSRFVFGFDWMSALLLGAIVSSTDAAAVFFLLRAGGITLRERVRATLEVESSSNDPMAIFLTIALVELMAAGSGVEEVTIDLFIDFLLQLGIGTVFGIVGGWVIRRVIDRDDLDPGLYPIIFLSLALVLFGVTAMAEGSGFLAVYLAGIVVGTTRLRHGQSLRRFSHALTWLSQIAMFLTLGLLATPSEFLAVAPGAIAVAVFLMFIARPVAVWLCLLPFGFSRYEVAFIAWVGLRGAVSILLAILPMVGGMEEGRQFFNIAFIVVLVSLLVQGWSIKPVARWLGLIVPARLGPVQRIELELPGSTHHEIVSYKVHPESRVARGERIPRWARPSLVIRDGASLKPHTAGRPLAGDQVYIVTPSDYVDLLDRLFAGAADGAPDPELYGEFALAPDALVGEVADVYGLPVPDEARRLTLREYLRRGLAGDIEPGDRVSVGDIDLIVRSVDDTHAIREVGLAVEHRTPARPPMPVFQGRREIAAWLRERKQRRRAEKAAAAAPVSPAAPADGPGLPLLAPSGIAELHEPPAVEDAPAGTPSNGQSPGGDGPAAAQDEGDEAATAKPGSGPPASRE